MAKRAILDGHAVHFEYRFDRLLPQKVAQAYELLVPEIRRPVGSTELNSAQEIPNEPSRCNLHPGFFRSTEGERHDCESDGGSGGIRQGSWVRRAAGMDLPRRRV